MILYIYIILWYWLSSVEYGLLSFFFVRYYLLCPLVLITYNAQRFANSVKFQSNTVSTCYFSSFLNNTWFDRRFNPLKRNQWKTSWSEFCSRYSSFFVILSILSPDLSFLSFSQSCSLDLIFCGQFHWKATRMAMDIGSHGKLCQQLQLKPHATSFLSWFTWVNTGFQE